MQNVNRSCRQPVYKLPTAKITPGLSPGEFVYNSAVECVPGRNFVRLALIPLAVRLGAVMEAPSLKELYPTLTAEELKEADENLENYLAVAWEIYEDMLDEERGFDVEHEGPQNETERSAETNQQTNL